ncbi:MAG: alpha/beta hydrolase [Chloroflexi bacterium]|nr:alpha/beta hydrolase [Chloroflexota bacterium]
MSQTKLVDGKVRLADGLMHYVAAGEGAPLVLAHPLGRSVSAWSEVMGVLAEKRAVYAVDIMGHGDSDKPSREYSIADYAWNIVEFMKSMKLDKASLIGNSIGATIVANVAASHPGLVEKLVLVGCPFRKTEQERREGLEMAKPQYDAAGNPLPRTMEDIKPTYVHASPALLDTVNAERDKAGVWCWKAMISLASYDPVPAIAAIRCPTLFVFGEKDLLRAKERALKARAKGSKLAVIPDSGHLPQVDNPKAFLEAVLPFLG